MGCISSSRCLTHYESYTLRHLRVRNYCRREVIRQGLLRNVPFSDSITQDNVGAPLANGCNCGYDNRSDVAFIAANPALNLPSTWSSAAYITALRGKGVGGDQLMADPIVKQKILFDFKSQLEAWKDIYSSIKAEAVARGRPEPAVYGNVHIVETVYSVLIAPYVDVVWTEQPAEQPIVGQPTWGGNGYQALSALEYKLGASAGNQTWKPHFGIVTLTCGESGPSWHGPPQTLTAVMSTMEALAGGGSAGLLYGDVPSNQTVAGLGPCANETLGTSQFVSNHRALFGGDRTRIKDVGLLYSIPQELYRADSSLGQAFVYHGLEFMEVKGAAARVLENNHILYDVLLLDMPGISTYHHTAAAKLAQYKLLIMCAIDIISRGDMTALKNWTRKGGTLVMLDPNATATYDEQLGAGPRDVVAALLKDPGKGAVRVLGWEAIHDYFFLGENSSESRALETAFSPTSPSLQLPGLPKSAWINVWRHGGGPMRSVHIVNYNGNASTNVLHAIDTPFNVSLACNEADCNLISHAVLYRLGLDGAAGAAFNSSNSTYPPLILAVDKNASAITCSIPKGSIPGTYGAVVFSGDDSEYAARDAAASARKWRERLEIASRSRGIVRDDYATQLANATNALEAVQDPEANPAANFAKLHTTYTSLASSLQAAVDNITTFVARNARNARNATVFANATLKLSMESADGLLELGWKPLFKTSVYNTSAGFGWLPPADGGTAVVCTSNAIGEPGIDSLHSSSLQACASDPQKPGVVDNGAARFRIDVNVAQEYVVTVITGSYESVRQSATTEIAVSMPNDADAALGAVLPGSLVFSGEFEQKAFRIPYNHSGHIILEFRSGSAGSFYGDGQVLPNYFSFPKTRRFC